MSCCADGVLRASLEGFDAAWATFEERYIAELIVIEQRGKAPVLNAIKQEENLRQLESNVEGMQQLAEARRSLIACFGKLNATANLSGKGREDLGLEVLEAALRTRATAVGVEGASDGLAADVLASFNNLRSYLRHLDLNYIDPQLAQNPDLGDILARWEESWELGARYLVTSRVSSALDLLVAQLRAARQSIPAFSAMCDSYDARLFLVLPRMVIIGFLSAPAEREALIRFLLPSRFTRARGGSRVADGELRALIQRFHDVSKLLRTAGCVSWDALVMAASASEMEELCTGLQAEELTQVRELLLELERWSMELQRRCPVDWNQCSALLLRFVTSPGAQTCRGI